MHKHSAIILAYLKKKSKADVEQIVRETGLNIDQLLHSLEELKGIGAVTYTKKTDTQLCLTDEGNAYKERFPEERFADMVAEAEKKGMRIKAADIKEEQRIGFIWAKKNGWVLVHDGNLVITNDGREALRSVYGLREALMHIADSKGIDEKAVGALKRRGLVDIKERSYIDSVSITEHGRSIDTNLKDRIGEVTREIISSQSWKERTFEEYDVKVSGEKVLLGREHPIHEFIGRVRDAWLSMGFTESDGPVVNPAFWNFDVLFTPQDHPARDAHDTFFLSDPSEIEIEDKRFVDRVRRMHETNWRGKWDYQKSKRMVLRTHNTVLSARHIMELGGLPNEQYPVKRFFVGRVFRNESPDYKHLAEFYQSEGIVVGDNLNLSNLFYELKEFFGRVLGKDAKQIRFRPSYFPFTEPSLEVFYFNKRHNDFVELGGAGIIRREVCKALGTEKVVLAWGLGLDRLLLDVLELDDINELYLNRIAWLRDRKEV